ncbi:MAG: LL-diaminopimelate aminotransferase [Clostridiales bacterium]|nr:LL-diaminopimelate aminotransferase [Clostridiales bacterium]MCF8022727.1 LL-diaminopimelate aminotransferase [Clostridiales bacterium]
MTLQFEEATRVKNLPAYLFARIEKLLDEKREAGVDIISLGIGDPDLPTPDYIIDELKKEAEKGGNHRYPSSVGMIEYRKSVADWYKRRFGVDLDPQSEVVSLVGSKEGIAHISWCYLNPGDTVLVPDPAYPVYSGGSILAGAEPYYIPLKAENDFLPELNAIPADVAKKAKMIFLNYPNNPTGAVATEEFYKELVAFAKEYNILVCHDAAYSEIAFDGYKPLSFLEIPGAKDVGIEFHSVSKTFNMTGWRIGWAVGNPDVVGTLGRLKSNLDSGQFEAVQFAAMKGLDGTDDFVKEMCNVYQERRDVLIEGLNDMGWNLEKPKSTFYVWVPVPSGYTSESFMEAVLDKAGVVVTPGTGYGVQGQGYFRVALTVSKERIQEAMQRIKDNLGAVKF